MILSLISVECSNISVFDPRSSIKTYFIRCLNKCSIVSNIDVQVKYLGEEGASSPVGAAAVVNCPWDLLVRYRTERCPPFG